MYMFKRIQNKIAAKLWLSLGTMVVGMFCVVGLSAYQRLQTKKRLHEIKTVLMPASTLSQSSYLAYESAVQHFLDAVSIGEPELLDLAQDQIGITREKLRDLRRLAGLAPADTETVKLLLTETRMYSEQAIPVYTQMTNAPETYTDQKQASILLQAAQELRDRLEGLKDSYRFRIAEGLEKVEQIGKHQLIVAVAAFLFLGTLSTALAWYLVKTYVIHPILVTRQQAQRIADGDLTARVELNQNDEFADLAAALNKMTEKLNSTINALALEADTRREAEEQVREANQILEERVKERTAALERAHQEMIDVARTAGMAEVATNVLHNVGNVLNSVNVTTATIRDKLNDSRISNLSRLVELLHEHVDNLGSFFTEDKRGRRMPEFLDKLTQRLTGEKDEVMSLAEELSVLVNHIATIIQVQQQSGRKLSMEGLANLADIIDDTIRINEASAEHRRIEIIRDYEPIPETIVDRHLLLQILNNLVTNARNATLERDHEYPKIIITLRQDGDSAEIAVTDNGIGISSQNMARLFEHGFTTRKEGHGFGLHSSANAAKQMGGQLTVSSQGINCGATFTLILPLVKSAVQAMKIQQMADPA